MTHARHLPMMTIPIHDADSSANGITGSILVAASIDFAYINEIDID